MSIIRFYVCVQCTAVRCARRGMQGWGLRCARNRTRARRVHARTKTRFNSRVQLYLISPFSMCCLCSYPPPSSSPPLPHTLSAHGIDAGQFYAQERVFVNRFNEVGLPSAVARLEAAVGAPIQLQCDLVSVLGQCSLQSRRLPTVKTIVTRTKYSEKAVIVAGKGLGVAKETAKLALGAAQATYARPVETPLSNQESARGH